MTRCPCSRSKCKPNTSFFYKVLSSLKQLQTHRRYGNGACLKDIAKFMNQTYILSGDTVSQIENVLNAAEGFRFVIKKKNVYSLLSPVATLQFTPEACIKAKLERLREVFNTKWYEDQSCNNPCPDIRNSHSPPHFISPNSESRCQPVSKSPCNSKQYKNTCTPQKKHSPESRCSKVDSSQCSSKCSPCPSQMETRSSSLKKENSSLRGSSLSTSKQSLCSCNESSINTKKRRKPYQSRRRSKKRRRTSRSRCPSRSPNSSRSHSIENKCSPSTSTPSNKKSFNANTCCQCPSFEAMLFPNNESDSDSSVC